MPMWRNWYTHITQNDANNIHVGSSPTIGTNDLTIPKISSIINNSNNSTFRSWIFLKYIDILKEF